MSMCSGIKSVLSAVTFSILISCDVLLAAFPSNLCFERISRDATISLVGHPLGRSYALKASKKGLIQLIKIPAVRSTKIISVVKTWLNITARVKADGEQGLLGIAFHPKYISNGRFYVSYICDANKFPDCKGPCACNSDIGCSIGKFGASCNSNTIIAEYRVFKPKHVLEIPSTVESKRLMTYGRPFGNHNGGDIFFGKDGFLYITSGDGGLSGDPFNAAQSEKSFLGKVLRIDVNSKATKNYTIPASNPFVGNKTFLPEIYALGLRNPWRCGVDRVNGNIFCGDVGQNKVEEVDQIFAGKNYGWARYEGNITYNAKVTPLRGTELVFPLFQYAHWGQNIPGIPAGGYSVIGGQVYRGPRNSCLQGKYIYNDLGGIFWVSTVYPNASEMATTTQVSVKCDPKSPVACGTSNGKVAINSPWGWATDSVNDVFALANDGVYRITNLAHCGVNC